MIHKRSTALERSIKYFTGWFKPVLGANLTLSSDVDQSKKKDKDQESIQSSTTPDTGCQWKSDNFKIGHHKQRSRGQPFPSR